MPDIILSEFIEPELAEIWATIAADQPTAANRFLESAYRTFTLLAATPRMGRLRTFSAKRIRQMRSFQVDGFVNYLIFYQAAANGIHVLHVFHGARDLDALFAEGA